jgi:hypothetical protein
MNIARVADEKSAPSWFAAVAPEVESCNVEEVERINVAKEVNDIVLAQECDRIEACSSNGSKYHYNSKWDDATVSHLKEYAKACGMKSENIRGFNPENITAIASTKEPFVRTAQVACEEEISLKDIWKDPFNIEERSNTSYMDAANWETVTKQNVIDKIATTGGNVVPLRGDDNYFLNSDVNPAINQNSITNPYAIEQLAKSTEDDTGVRLKKEIAAKEAQKLKNHSDWQKEKIAAMDKLDIVSKGTVFPTESLNASTGLNKPSSQMGVYAKFDPSSIPEKTKGESLASINAKHKESIQRPKVENDWEKPSRQSARSISDDFVTALASKLEQLKK